MYRITISIKLVQLAYLLTHPNSEGTLMEMQHRSVPDEPQPNLQQRSKIYWQRSLSAARAKLPLYRSKGSKQKQFSVSSIVATLGILLTKPCQPEGWVFSHRAMLAGLRSTDSAQKAANLNIPKGVIVGGGVTAHSHPQEPTATHVTMPRHIHSRSQNIAGQSFQFKEKLAKLQAYCSSSQINY